jgi:hypothetical protein
MHGIVFFFKLCNRIRIIVLDRTINTNIKGEYAYRLLSLRINYYSFLTFPGAFLSGIFVYFAMSYMLIQNPISIPLSIIISILVFGLTRYYSESKQENNLSNNKLKKTEQISTEYYLQNGIFIITYCVFLAIVISASFSGTQGIFVDWDKITPIQVLYLTAATAFSFFMPGYAFVLLLKRKFKLRLLLQLLLAYLFSIFITGLQGYIIASLGYKFSETTVIFIGCYVLIFSLYLQQSRGFSKSFSRVTTYPYHQFLHKISKSLIKNSSQLIVFSSLFALVILYTFYLHDGKIIVDQWYLHGRALLMDSGLFRDLAPSDEFMPPFFSSLLAVLFNLSGSPSVNAYVFIGFLNIVPVFAFYYFVTNWIPRNIREAALLASTLFMLSSGFGWLYILNTAISSNQTVTFDESLNLFNQAYLKTFDIQTPTTFINVGHPDITTFLIIIALPAGFTLLGLIKEAQLFSFISEDNDKSKSKSKYLRIITSVSLLIAISFVGILGHDEFYLFIIVASSAIVVFFRLLPRYYNYSIFFVSFLSAMSLVFLLDIFISPARFYTDRPILGIPLLVLCFTFVSFSWALYLTFRKIRISNVFGSYRIKEQTKAIIRRPTLIRKITLNFLNDYQIRFLKISIGIILVLTAAYLYLFTVLVWNTLSVDDITSQIKQFNNVPWYLYPVKFGLTGLLGLAFVLSYISKKFEKEIFIFGLIILFAFFAGPYYDEHRFGKYIMSGMAAFAALLIWQILSSNRLKINLEKPLVTGLILGVVIPCACLSVFMYAGWVDLFTQQSDWIEGGRWDFPTKSEIDLLNFLNTQIPNSKVYNIALTEKETSNERGLATKIYGFSPVSRPKLLQSPLTLNASTLEGLYNLLDYADVGYIILPKKDLITGEDDKDIKSSNNDTYRSDINSVIRFVLDNFPKAYEDQNYMVLQVLPMSASLPQSSNVALVYQRDFQKLFPAITKESTILPTDFGLFGSQTEESSTKNNSNYNDNVSIRKIEGENKSSNSTAYSVTLGGNFSDDDGKRISLWSPDIATQNHSDLGSGNNIHSTVNYMEDNFRIIAEWPGNKSDENKADNFDASLLWEQNNKYYRVSIGKDGLELYQANSSIPLLYKDHEQEQESSDYGREKMLSQNQEVKRQKGIWYNIKILSSNNIVAIYVNDILRIKAPIDNYYFNQSSEKNNTDYSISKVGIGSYYSKSEFQPIKIGSISQLTEQSFASYEKEKMYPNHYFPLSILALSKIRYDTFLDGDMSAFSKKYVVLPYDVPTYEITKIGDYLEFIDNGGNLIVMNSDDYFTGAFSKLLSIKPGNLTKFDGIESYDPNSDGKKKNNLYISGVARNIGISPQTDLTVKSFYTSKDDNIQSKQVAPLGIEKNYGKGKIIFVNLGGYFHATFDKSPSTGNSVSNENPNFASMSKFAHFIGIPDDNRYVKNDSDTITFSTLAGIIGDLRIFSRQTVMINGSSLLLSESIINDKNPQSYNLTVKSLSVLTNPFQTISVTKHNSSNDAVNVNLTDSNFIANTGQNVTHNNINYVSNNSSYPHYNNYDFKNVIIKDLKLYGGPFQVIIKIDNSSDSVYLPVSSTYNDYFAMSIPKGVDIIIKFPDNNLTHVQLEMMEKKKQNSFQTLRISGNNNNNDYNNRSNNTGQILFDNVKTDLEVVKYIPTLMKSPQITIKNEAVNDTKEAKDEGTRAIGFKKNSPNDSPTEIQKGNGDIQINLDHADNYDQAFENSTITRFITYLKNDIQMTYDDKSIIPLRAEQSLFAKSTLKKPGDISDYAKDEGIDVPWRDVLYSQTNITLIFVIVAIAITAIALSWYRIRKLNN